MPVFEVQGPDGKVYEVEAADENQAASAFQPEASAPAQKPSLFDTLGRAMFPVDTREADAEVMKGLVRSPLTFAEGAGQAATRLGNVTGLVSDERSAEYDAAVNAQRTQGPLSASPTAIMTGEAASMLIPGAAASKAPRAGGILANAWQWGKSLTKSAAAGGVMGSTSYLDDPEGSKLAQVAWGAAFPAAFQSIAGAGAAARNTVASWLQKGEKARNAAARVQAEDFFKGSQAVPEPAPLTPAQATGNPNIARLEQRAREGNLQELNAQQLDDVRTRFDELADAADTTLKGERKITSKAYSAVDTLDSQMRIDRSREFEAGMNDVIKLSRQNNSRVSLNELRKTYSDILGEDGNPFNVAGSVLPANFRRAHALLTDMSQQGFQPTVENVAEIMKGLSQGANRSDAILSGADAKLEMYRKRLWGALNNDLNAASQAGVAPGAMTVAGQAPTMGMQADPAFIRLQQVRQLYARRSARLERLENDAVNQIFGSREVLATPRAALDKFYGLPDVDQRYAVKILSRRAPEVLGAMQADRIRQSLQAATKLGPASQSTFDAQAFTNAMFNGKNAAADSRMFTEAQRKTMREGAAHLQVLMNHLPSHGGGSVVWPEELAINAVSQNPAFIARIVTRMAYGRYGDELLGTPEGLRALRTFTGPDRTKGQAVSGAVAWVLSKINQEDGDESQQGGP